MEITNDQSGSSYILRLQGRLDATWAAHVENAITAAIRGGNHQVALDMAGVPYISSAGLRVLLIGSRQLRAIKGTFTVINPSEDARSVLDLAGLTSLIAELNSQPAAVLTIAREESSAQATYEIFPHPEPLAPGRVSAVGAASALQTPAGEAAKFEFGMGSFAIGVGALGEEFADCSPRFGEFLTVAGVAAYQPTDGSSRADFLVREGGLIPEGYLLLGLEGEAKFPIFARFEKRAEAPSVGLAELAEQALKWSGGEAAALVLLTETMGLVGAALRKSPSLAEDGDRFAFPRIRDWLSFTNERGYRDTSSLIVGVAAREGHALSAHLRPLGDGLIGHFHAASFPYRPLQKGQLELEASVRQAFDGNTLQAVLHLLADRREFTGIGESEFLRGALWASPITPS